MKFYIFGLTLILLVLIAAGCAPADNVKTNEEAELPQTVEQMVAIDGYTLIWQDEFDGNQLNPENWTYGLGGGGWGNHELQTYTNNPENVRVEDGHLIIEAIKHETGTRQYTSARLKTEELFSFTYGRVEARIKLPYGKGIWSAFWLLGEDYATAVWPNSGEIDIMESIGEAYITYGGVHGPGYSGGANIGDHHVSETVISEDFHVFAIEWEPEVIRWYVDDDNFLTVTPQNLTGQWVFDHPFFIILNIAVGGDWPGAPNDTTEFPQQMLVDYVRVYQSSDQSTAAASAGGEMFVDSVTIKVLEEDGEGQGEVFVKVINQDGVPVAGARVNGGWLGVVRKGDGDKVTDENGIAGPFYSQKTPSEGEISFCVTSVVGGGHSYDKAQNNQTCAFGEP